MSTTEQLDIRRTLIDNMRAAAVVERDRIARTLVDDYAWARIIPAAGEAGHEEWRAWAADAGLTRGDGGGLRQIFLPAPGGGPGEPFFRARRDGQAGAGWSDIDRDVLTSLARLVAHLSDVRTFLAATARLTLEEIRRGEYPVLDWLCTDRWEHDQLVGELHTPMPDALAAYLERLVHERKRAYAVAVADCELGTGPMPERPDSAPWADDVIRKVRRYARCAA
jgi:hypothetical protein